MEIGTIGAVLGGIVVLVILCMGYVKAPPDQAYIISGLRKHSRVVLGGQASRCHSWSGWIN